jgi:hypothetical protein
MKHYTKTSQPFDFLSVAQLAFPGLVRCCDTPRPSCPVSTDRKRWAEQPWRCLSCGASIAPYRGYGPLRLQDYRRVVAHLTCSIELKRLPASGAEPTPETMRGLTIPRPVHVTSVEHIGKEVIVDPTDIPEELTAEQLSETEVLVYRDERKTLEAWRGRIGVFGVSNVSRTAKVHRSTIKAFVNQGSIPQLKTIAKIEAALQRLGAAALTRGGAQRRGPPKAM